MTYKLKKPYTDLEKADFIVKYNHNKGFLIEETEEGLTASEPPKPTIEELKEAKRLERNRLLEQTDVKMLPDYPITEEEKKLWINYRKYLRDLPQKDEFPNVDVLTFNDWNK